MIAGQLTWAAPTAAAPSDAVAPSDVVDVWFERVDGCPAPGKLFELLDDDERRRAGRFRFERDRTRFVARRAFLRRVLADYVDVPPARISYRTSAMGRPELEPSFGIAFSASHADGLAVVAVARERLVGADLERLRPIADALDLARRLFTRGEYDYLESLAEAKRSEAFLTLWTRKESYVKAVGAGMSMPFDGFEVLDPGGGRAQRRAGSDGRASIVFTTLDGPAGYVGTVAASGAAVALRHVTRNERPS